MSLALSSLCIYLPFNLDRIGSNSSAVSKIKFNICTISSTNSKSECCTIIFDNSQYTINKYKKNGKKKGKKIKKN